ncbi:MAG: hypothetical protein SH847_03380 [Roseiflexaceae bacterium]|nr:hypothetical protein [Roseiflexaceae bacterium]
MEGVHEIGLIPLRRQARELGELDALRRQVTDQTQTIKRLANRPGKN